MTRIETLQAELSAVEEQMGKLIKSRDSYPAGDRKWERLVIRIGALSDRQWVLVSMVKTAKEAREREALEQA